MSGCYYQSYTKKMLLHLEEYKDFNKIVEFIKQKFLNFYKEKQHLQNIVLHEDTLHD